MRKLIWVSLVLLVGCSTVPSTKPDSRDPEVIRNQPAATYPVPR